MRPTSVLHSSIILARNLGRIGGERKRESQGLGIREKFISAAKEGATEETCIGEVEFLVIKKILNTTFCNSQFYEHTHSKDPKLEKN